LPCASDEALGQPFALIFAKHPNQENNVAITYLKKADKTPETETATAQKVVNTMLDEIQQNGEAAVRKYANDLDQWTGEVIITKAQIEANAREVPEQVKADIDFAIDKIFVFIRRLAELVHFCHDFFLFVNNSSF
jgi:histidinol dehydrogenase